MTTPKRSRSLPSPQALAIFKARNPDGVARGARAGTCRDCGAYVFAGLDDDRCAWPVVVEARPLNAIAEMVALVGGRLTFHLTWLPGRGRYEIDPRSLREIERHAPGSVPNTDVVVQHECGAAELPAGRTAIVKAKRQPVTSAEPPF